MRSVLVVGAGGADALELAAAAVPNFADGRDAIVRVSAYIMEQRKAGQRVILCAGSDAERTKLARLVERHAGASAAQLHRWSEVAVTEPGSLASLVLELSAGFTAPGLTVLTSADVLGAPSPVAATGPAIAGGDAFATEALRPGDLVVHAQHGIGRLAGLERLDQDEIARECLSINYAVPRLPAHSERASASAASGASVSRRRPGRSNIPGLENITMGDLGWWGTVAMNVRPTAPVPR